MRSGDWKVSEDDNGDDSDMEKLMKPQTYNEEEFLDNLDAKEGGGLVETQEQKREIEGTTVYM